MCIPVYIYVIFILKCFVQAIDGAGFEVEPAGGASDGEWRVRL